MHVLRMLDASYARDGTACVAPVSLEVSRGERVAKRCGDAREARLLAMMAAALVKATNGIVLIGEFDPRVQPAHCKALASFVPHDPLPPGELRFDRLVAYRAALWNLDAAHARSRASALLERLDGIHEAFAFPIVAALLSAPALLVLDRPQHAWASKILNAARNCAVFSTHVEGESARAFAPELAAAQV